MIDKKVIEHIAKLARLEIDEKKAEQYSKELTQVFNHFEQIEKVNTSGIDPLVTPTEIAVFLREDIENNQFTPEEIMSNAPSRAGNLFKVPPVV